MELLYSIFILPIVVVLSKIFSLLFSATHNYGISLVLLSIVVNTILVPLYKLADAWRNKEKQAQAIMKPDLEAIKTQYVGREKYYSMRAAHRIYHYNSFMSLRVSLGLLIQIPFFLAAYNLLSHYEGLQGVAFFGIADLASPDGLLWGYNVLPIIMTFVNLFNGLIYNKNLEPKELLQVWSMSLLFLFLLYDAPAGLVLYWTINNVYSSSKYLIIQKPSFSALLRQLYAHLCTIVRREQFRVFVRASWITSFLMAMLYATHAVRSIPSGSNAIKLAILFLMLPMPFLCIMGLQRGLRFLQGECWARNRSSEGCVSRFFEKYYTHIFMTLVGISVAVDVVLFWDLISHSYAIAASNRLKQIILLKYVLSSVCMYFPFRRCSRDGAIAMIQNRDVGSNESFLKAKNFRTRAGCFVLLSAILFVLVYIISPVLIYISAPKEIGGSLSETLLFLLPYMLISMGVVYALYVLCARYRYFLSTMMVLLLSIVFVYGFIINLKLGVATNWRFQNELPLVLSMRTQVLESFLWFGVGILLYWYYRKYYVHTVLAYCSMFLVLCIITGAGLYKYHVLERTQSLEAKNIEREAEAEENALPSNASEIFSFSKEKNIVVVVLDAAMGNKFNTLLDIHPDMNRKLDGFTWYKNTVSTSPGTYSSITAMVRGQDYTIDKFNENNARREKKVKYRDEVFDAWRYWGEALPDYAVAYMNPTDGISTEQFATIENVKVGTATDYIDYWKSLDKNKALYADLYGDFFNTSYLSLLSIFRIAPVHIKQRLYNDEYLSFNIKALQARNIQDRFFNTWSWLDLMPDISNAHATRPTFKFYWSLMSHAPFYFADDCVTVNLEGVWNGSYNTFGDDEGLKQTYCALDKLNDFFEWMKKEDVYDNSKIIFVSDHGGTEKTGEAWNVQAIYALLLVKDVNSRGMLKIDDELLMSNADVASLIKSAVPEYDLGDIPEDPTTSNKPRTVTYNVGEDYWIFFKNEDDTHFEMKYQMRFSSGENVYDIKDSNYVYPEKK